MPKVRNASDYDLELVLPDGSRPIVEKGHQIEVSAEVRDSLVEQDNWAEVKATSSSGDSKKDEGE